MRPRNFLAALLGVSTGSPTVAANFDTPESAVQALEAAYVHKDIEAAVAAKDFHEEARLMLQKMNPGLATDAGILKQTSQVLELSFRDQIRKNGFPKFADLRCSIIAKQQVSPTLVRLTEQCVFADGGTSSQDLFTFKGAAGWRVVVVPRNS